MDPLTWTGALDWVNPLLGGAVLVVLLGIAMQMVWPLLPTSPAGARRLGQITTAGIAASRPSAVANRASAIPGATTARLVFLVSAMA